MTKLICRVEKWEQLKESKEKEDIRKVSFGIWKFGSSTESEKVWESIPVELLQALADGFGMCLPWSCLGDTKSIRYLILFHLWQNFFSWSATSVDKLLRIECDNPKRVNTLDDPEMTESVKPNQSNRNAK